MDAVDALNEIAFWLERSAAPTFKVQAFRKAAGVIADLAADDLAERARDGRLKRTKGIGDTTFQVIRQAVEGAVPDYLDKLRQSGAEPLAAGGNGLRPSSGAICTATATGLTADRPLTSWRTPRGTWAANTSP